MYTLHFHPLLPIHLLCPTLSLLRTHQRSPLLIHLSIHRFLFSFLPHLPPLHPFHTHSPLTPVLAFKSPAITILIVSFFSSIHSLNSFSFISISPFTYIPITLHFFLHFTKPDIIPSFLSSIPTPLSISPFFTLITISPIALPFLHFLPAICISYLYFYGNLCFHNFHPFSSI